MRLIQAKISECPRAVLAGVTLHVTVDSVALENSFFLDFSVFKLCCTLANSVILYFVKTYVLTGKTAEC